MLLNRRPVFAGRVISVAVERVALPNGHESELEIVRHPGGAAVVAIDVEGRVCLLRQYRHAADGWVWELPAGKLEPGEPPATTAARELVEEAAVSAGRLESLGQILSTPGVFTEVIQAYLRRIEYGADGYASLIHAPAYEHAKVVLDPTRAFGAPIFERGGARIDDVLQRFWAGESIDDLGGEFGVPSAELEDVLRVASRRAA